MLTLTDNAVKKFKDVIEEEGSAQSGIRIFLMSGG